MDEKKEFEKVMSKSETIAIATAADNIPNVRIVNFVYLASEKILYFASTKGDPKEKEFSTNSAVAFTTIPTKGLAHVRVHHANVGKSKKTVFDAADIFAAKMPWCKANIEQNGKNMDLYEVCFKTATVLPSPDQAFQIEL
jgi:uncharacterized pyridoxamine 5'-phosphate oxidase family protein